MNEELKTSEAADAPPTGRKTRPNLTFEPGVATDTPTFPDEPPTLSDSKPADPEAGTIAAAWGHNCRID